MTKAMTVLETEMLRMTRYTMTLMGTVLMKMRRKTVTILIYGKYF